jgi:hypothetical protein
MHLRDIAYQIEHAVKALPKATLEAINDSSGGAFSLFEAAAMTLTRRLNPSASNECSLSVSDANLPLRES